MRTTRQGARCAGFLNMPQDCLNPAQLSTSKSQILCMLTTDKLSGEDKLFRIANPDYQ